MSTMVAQRTARCPRCSQWISRGTKVEQYSPHGSGVMWAHVGCKPTKADDDSDADVFDDGDDCADGFSVPPKTGATETRQTLVSLLNDAMPNVEKTIERNVFEKVNAEVHKFEQNASQEIATLIEKIAKDSTNAVNNGVNLLDQRFQETQRDLLALAQSVQKKVVTFTTGTTAIPADDDEVFNVCFPEVMELLLTGENVFIPGPTGCGKTHLAQQIAKYIPNDDGTFGREFGLITGSGGVTEAEVKGVAIPNITTGENVYLPTRFLELYENGGVVLIDEADAMDPNVLMVLNAALSNGYISIPKRTSKPMAYRHKDFVMIFSANTMGQGADRHYVGRNKLDAATLDRFVFVPMDYDVTIERRLCPDPDLYGVLTHWRKEIEKGRISRILSTRFVSFAYRWRHKGIAYIARKLTRDRGWTKDEIKKVIDPSVISKMDAVDQPRDEAYEDGNPF